jgi:subtilisin family serine protease
LKHAAAVLAALLIAAAAARAQQPTVSPALERLARQETQLVVWLMAQPGRGLADVEQLILQVGGRVRHRSRWLHAVSAMVPAAALGLLRTQPGLRHIQPVVRFQGRREFIGSSVTSLTRAPGATLADTLYGPSLMPIRQLNLLPLAERGIRGAGIKIAVLDTGFETDHAAFAAADVIAQRDFVFGDSTVRNETGDAADASRHGTAVWSLLAASIPNQLIGIASEAEYILAKTEDVRSETTVEEDNYVAALEWADSLGADVVTSSLSYLTFDDNSGYTFDQLNGDIAITTVAADSAAARGITVVTSAGNGGSQGFRSIGTPADGDSVIAVGAEDSLGVLQAFSSRGPTADGRLKPDLTAPGFQVFAVDVLSGSGFTRFNGTSFSAPLIAGTAALLRQLHPTFGPMDVLEAMRRAGTNRDAPDSLVGWGRPDAALAAVFPVGLRVTSPPDTLLGTVTPLFAWDVGDVPAFGQPVTYRLRIAVDSAFTELSLDTTLSDTEVQLDSALAPGQRLRFELEATSADSTTLLVRPQADYVVPEWATLLTFNDQAGITIRERRPTFSWTSPEVISPPGPFTYDLAVLRVDNGLAADQVRGLTETQYTPARDLDLNTAYRWQLIARLGTDSAVIESRSTFLIVDESMPTATLLFQNFPNPFPNEAIGISSTCIWFDLANEGEVILDILDVRGHVVRNVVPGTRFPTTLQPGRYGRGESGGPGSCDPALQWDGTASNGGRLPRGIYVIRLKTPDGTFLKRVVYLGERL